MMERAVGGPLGPHPGVQWAGRPPGKPVYMCIFRLRIYVYIYIYIYICIYTYTYIRRAFGPRRGEITDINPLS